MNKRNFQREQSELIESFKGRPSLLLHCCCAPCASYCVEYLNQYFDLTLFFYNPNISSKEEYARRSLELKRLICEMPSAKGVRVIIAPYDHKEFLGKISGNEGCPEGGARCYDCYGLRLEKTAEKAVSGEKFDFFCTTLSISPLKNVVWINEIGERLSEKYGVAFLPSDFKKNSGFLRSTELSKEYGLYRQNYCGCEFSVKNG